MKNIIRKLWEYGPSIPTTIYFNLRMFPLRIAIRMPILISRHVWLEELHGHIQLPENPKIFGIHIGFGRVGIFDYQYGRTILQLSGGTISFQGTASIGQGTRIVVGPNGQLIFGNNFCVTAETAIICYNRIEFGEDSLVSWQCQFMDTDFHHLYKEEKLLNCDRPIKIGKHCWICSHCLIFKGSILKDDCVLGGAVHSVPYRMKLATC